MACGSASDLALAASAACAWDTAYALARGYGLGKAYGLERADASVAMSPSEKAYALKTESALATAYAARAGCG